MTTDEARNEAAHSATATWRKRVEEALLAPMDAAGLAYFRIVFFAVIAWEAWRLLDHNWIGKYFSGKEIYFKFWPFDFVHPLPAEGLRVLIIAMGVVSVMAMCGFLYRLSAAAVFVMITYIFLIDKARYLNHLYLVCLIACLMIFLPAHRYFSLDARLRPGLRSSRVPAWTIQLLRFQVAVPYFFGGIAKINEDWLRGEPLRDWLSHRTGFPVIGEYFEYEPVVWAMTYGALLLDLFVPFLLLHRRTRILGFASILLFHFMNSRLFNIGIFPWTMIAATVIFFEPDWPRRIARDVRRGHVLRSPAFFSGCVFGAFTGAFLPDDFHWMHVLIGGLGCGVAAYHLDEPWRKKAAGAKKREVPAPRGATRVERFAFALLGLWVAIQVLVPLRHFVIPGNVHWTEEGHRFAWHMKLRDKSARGFFLVTDPASGRVWKVDPKDHLSRFQRRKMLSRPDMAVQFAHFLEDLKRQEGYEDVEVRAIIHASLNARDRQPFLDPDVDLTRVPYPWFGRAEWILPLTEPLKPGG